MSDAAHCSVGDRPGRWRLLVRADFVSGSGNGTKQRILLSELYRMIFSDAEILTKSRLFETLQHVVMGGLRAELRSEPFSV